MSPAPTLGCHGEPVDTDTRGPVYCIAAATVSCGSCGCETPVVAIYAPAGHARLEGEENPFGEAAEWQTATLPAMLFGITYLPYGMLRRLHDAAPAFRPVSHETDGSCWMNRCGRCDALIDDAGLFCEAGGAFMPMSAEEAVGIRLIRVEERFEVAASGYSPFPELLRFMRGS